jgi:thiol:disulfide interchange protein
VNNVEVGYKLAQERGLPCLFFFTANWCTFCHRMAETAFPDEQVGQLGQNFVCVLVDADRERGVCQYFAVSGYPTVEFVSPQGQSLHRLVGQQSAADLAVGMQSALGRYAWLSKSVVR